MTISIQPAAACAHTQIFIRSLTGCCGCAVHPGANTTCQVIDCDDCTQFDCAGTRAGAAAQGNLLNESLQQCSLEDKAWSRLEGPTAAVRIEVVKLKARS